MHCDFHWATEKPPATLRKRTISLSLVQSSRESTVSARMMTDRLTDESIINGSSQYPSGLSRVLLPFPFLNISSKCKITVHPFNRTYSSSTLSSSTIFEAFEKRKGGRAYFIVSVAVNCRFFAVDLTDGMLLQLYGICKSAHPVALLLICYMLVMSHVR